MDLDTRILSATHIKQLTTDDNNKPVERKESITHTDKIVYLYVLAEWRRLKRKGKVMLTCTKLSARTGMSEASVKRSVKKWRQLGVFECGNTYKEDGSQHPLTYINVVDVAKSKKYKWYGEYLSKWLKSQYDRAIKQAKDHTDNKDKTPSQWRTFRKNCAYEIERGQYFSGDEKALVWTKQLAPSGVVFEWTR